ncbi:Thioredoxin- transmembrane protein 2 [Haplosporangium sp. Z 767]|nr:Thioredoxin- transmembrane protein 2 [Haplosporangium sp. Z 11]KAF9182114.1 Thioredoxin- transmembrane protein 2 [Haplosporangium sp. Z 767]
MVLLSIKVRGSQSAEELVSVIALYVKVYSLYGFWSINQERALFWDISWSGCRVFQDSKGLVLIRIYVPVIFISLPQPSYQGPSKIIWLNASQLEFLTTPNQKKSKGKERASTHSNMHNRSSTAKIVELDNDGEPLENSDEDHSHDHIKGEPHENHASELDPNHYWIIAFNATWSSPCRHFEAVLARCSIKYEKKNVHFAKIDMDMVPEGDYIADRFKINLSATTLDLPTLILFKDGKPLKQLPLKLGTKVGGEVLGKVGWDRSEASVVNAFELDKLGTGRESFAS